MTAALLLAPLLAAAAPSPDYRVVVRNGAETAWVALAVETGRGPLPAVESRLLGNRPPTPDGGDLLDRLLDHGRLLRVDAAPAHPHAGTVTAALAAALDRNGDGVLDADELATATTTLLARFDLDGDECLVPLEIVPDLPTAVPPRVRTTLAAVTVVRPGEPLPEGLADAPAARVVLRVGTASRQRVKVVGVALDLATVSARLGETLAVPRSLTKAGREADRARFEEVAANVSTLTVRPEPRGWFEILDADGDGQLSVRELRAAPQLLVGATARPTGPVVSVTLTPGTAARPPVPLTKAAPLARGPDWFRALDRNGDGDVSRREFIGTAADFRAYDADGDGLISAAEADAGDRARPRKDQR